MADSGEGGLDAALDALRRLDVALEGVRAAFAHRHGITVNDSIVMSMLADAGEALTPTEIASSMNLTTGTLTTMLDRLERAGFVSRAPNPRDRRSLLVELSEQGDAALDLARSELRTAIGASVEPGRLADFSASVTALVTAVTTIAERVATTEQP